MSGYTMNARPVTVAENEPAMLPANHRPLVLLPESDREQGCAHPAGRTFVSFAGYPADPVFSHPAS